MFGQKQNSESKYFGPKKFVLTKILGEKLISSKNFGQKNLVKKYLRSKEVVDLKS